MTLGPTDSDMSDLQHEDAPREGSQEQEDAGEDDAASGYVSPASPAAAAPDTKRLATLRHATQGASPPLPAASSRKRRRAAAQRATGAASPARSQLRTNLDGAFARGGWSRQPAATLAPRPRRAPGHPVPRGQVAASAATDTPAPPAVEDNVLKDTVDMIAEGELDRDGEPAAGSGGATPVIGGRARTSGTASNS